MHFLDRRDFSIIFFFFLSVYRFFVIARYIHYDVFHYIINYIVIMVIIIINYFASQ